LAAQKLVSPSAERNLGPIREVLVERLSASGRVLEVASGTGQHIVAFAEAMPGLRWMPSDPDPEARTSIAAWIAECGAANLEPPLDLDMTAADWEGTLEPGFCAMLAINLLHIAPWAATEGLLRGAGSLLAHDGSLLVYGPFKREGRHTASSNEMFDRSLRSQNPKWGVRDITEVEAAAEPHGLGLDEVIAMPANNLVLRFRPRPMETA